MLGPATCGAVAVPPGFHACLTARKDEVFELADAVLCAGGPVRSLPVRRWRWSTGVVMAPCMTR
jgi:hypothetical protein